jgi:hypothetical protein
MSQLGQNAKYLPGAHVFRVSPDNGHAAAQQKLTLCATSGLMRVGACTGYQINRQLSGWNLPPLVIRAFGAHCQMATLVYPLQYVCFHCDCIAKVVCGGKANFPAAAHRATPPYALP